MKDENASARGRQQCNAEHRTHSLSPKLVPEKATTVHGFGFSHCRHSTSDTSSAEAASQVCVVVVSLLITTSILV